MMRLPPENCDFAAQVDVLVLKLVAQPLDIFERRARALFGFDLLGHVDRGALQSCRAAPASGHVDPAHRSVVDDPIPLVEHAVPGQDVIDPRGHHIPVVGMEQTEEPLPRRRLLRVKSVEPACLRGHPEAAIGNIEFPQTAASGRGGPIQALLVGPEVVEGALALQRADDDLTEHAKSWRVVGRPMTLLGDSVEDHEVSDHVTEMKRHHQNRLRRHGDPIRAVHCRLRRQISYPTDDDRNALHKELAPSPGKQLGEVDITGHVRNAWRIRGLEDSDDLLVLANGQDTARSARKKARTLSSASSMAGSTSSKGMAMSRADMSEMRVSNSRRSAGGAAGCGSEGRAW